MHRTAIADMIAIKSGIPQNEAAMQLNVVLEVLAEALATGEQVTLTGFGTFKIKDTAARLGLKPGTRERVPVPAGRRITFKAGTSLKEKTGAKKLTGPA